jgi:hypothetical protein
LHDPNLRGNPLLASRNKLHFDLYFQSQSHFFVTRKCGEVVLGSARYEYGKRELRDAVLTGLKAEFGDVLKQQADLHREMMRLPIEARCRRWMEYYMRLDELTTRQQRIEAAACLNHDSDRPETRTL